MYVFATAENNEEQNSDVNFDSEDENVGHDKDVVSTKDVRAGGKDAHNDNYQLHDDYDGDWSHYYEEHEDQHHPEEGLFVLYCFHILIFLSHVF